MAKCTYDGSIRRQVLSLSPRIALDPSIPVGAVLYSKKFGTGAYKTFTCSKIMNDQYIIDSTASAIPGVTGIQGKPVYETGIDGIGYQVSDILLSKNGSLVPAVVGSTLVPVENTTEENSYKFKETRNVLQSSIQEILKTYEIITIDNYVLNDYTQEIQNLIEIRSRKADILLEHDASTIKYLSSSLNIDNNNILCTWDRSLIEYKSIHKLQFHILSPIALIDLLSMAKGEKTNYALASYKNFAKLQNEQILEMSSIVWETLIKIERNELLDGELIRKAKSFQNTYAEKYHNLDELDQKKISEDWLAWKELH